MSMSEAAGELSRRYANLVDSMKKAVEDGVNPALYMQCPSDERLIIS